MKKVPTKSSKLWLAVLLGAVVVAGILFVKSRMQASTIALIAEQGTPAGSCTSNVASFTTTGACGNGLVVRADYECSVEGKKGYEGGDGKSCIDPSVAYQHAKQFCGQTCVATTSVPRPSTTPTAIPTSLPTPKPPSPVPSAVASSPAKPSVSPIPSGCRLEQVKCVKAPCNPNPVLVCATPTATAKPMPTPRPDRCFRVFSRSFCWPSFR
jgi:hypothetical protein